jgi:regulatory subunit for Cdc7p protein kinase
MTFFSALVNTLIILFQKVDDFFSNSITHFITNRSVPHSVATLADKENNPKIAHTSILKSPIKLKSR